MADQIYLAVDVSNASVVRVNGLCYSRIGESDVQPDAFQVEAEFESCETCVTSSGSSSSNPGQCEFRKSAQSIFCEFGEIVTRRSGLTEAQAPCDSTGGFADPEGGILHTMSRSIRVTLFGRYCLTTTPDCHQRLLLRDQTSAHVISCNPFNHS